MIRKTNNGKPKPSASCAAIWASRDIYDGMSKSRCPLCYKMDVFEVRMEMKLKCVIFAVFSFFNVTYVVEREIPGKFRPDPCDACAGLNQLSCEANWEVVIMWVDDK